MCTIRNLTTLSPLFASVTACLTKPPSVSPHGAPREAVNRLHDVQGIFILRQKMPRLHLYSGKRCRGGMFVFLQCINCSFTYSKILYLRYRNIKMLEIYRHKNGKATSYCIMMQKEWQDVGMSATIIIFVLSNVLSTYLKYSTPNRMHELYEWQCPIFPVQIQKK